MTFQPAYLGQFCELQPLLLLPQVRDPAVVGLLVKLESTPLSALVTWKPTGLDLLFVFRFVALDQGSRDALELLPYAGPIALFAEAKWWPT